MKPLAISALMIAATASGCSTSANRAGVEAASSAATAPVEIATPRRTLTDGGSASMAIPKAVAYRMTGDYANNVPITLTATGRIANYPAPSDITPSQKPVDLGNGWWLDRRGISDASVFTRYTYEEYSRLPQAPSPAELRKAIIPGARVVNATRLPMTLQDALSNPAAAKAALTPETLQPEVAPPAKNH